METTTQKPTAQRGPQALVGSGRLVRLIRSRWEPGTLRSKRPHGATIYAERSKWTGRIRVPVNRDLWAYRVLWWPKADDPVEFLPNSVIRLH